MANLSIESEFISDIISGKLSIDAINKTNFEPNYLEYNGEIYEWLFDYVNLNSELPTLELVQTRYPEFRFIETKNNPDQLIDAIRKNSELDRFKSAVTKSSTLLQNSGSVDVARNYLTTELEKFNGNTEQDVFDLSKEDDSNIVFEIYKEKLAKIESGEKIFIPSGLGKEMDNWLNGGWRGGDLIGVLAPLGTGKSWLSMLFASSAMKNKFSPFILALEGTLEKESYRSITTLAGTPNSDLHTAMLPELDFAKALVQIRNIAQETGTHYYLALHGTREVYTPSVFRQKLIKYKPGLAIVDYLSLMALSQKVGADDWAEFSAISKSLKRIAVSLEIPVIATLQGNRASLTKDSLDANDSSYFGILRDFDIVLGLAKVKGKKFILRINSVKGRDQEDVFDGYYRTDWNTGKTEFAGAVDENEGTF